MLAVVVVLFMVLVLFTVALVEQVVVVLVLVATQLLLLRLNQRLVHALHYCYELPCANKTGLRFSFVFNVDACKPAG